MLPPPRTVYWRLAIPIVFACVLLTVLIVASPNQPHAVVIGIVFGTAFQHPVIAACWFAMGPGNLGSRVCSSLGWTVVVGLSMALGIMAVVPGTSHEPFTFFLTTLAIWGVALGPMWLIRLFTGLRLRHQAPMCSSGAERQWQFGIRQLMLLTAVIATLLGAGRLLIANGFLPRHLAEEVRFVLFVSVAQILANFPLFAGALLPRHWSLGILVGLLFLAGVTAIEVPLAQQLLGGMLRDRWILFTSMNTVSALWSLTLVGVIRGSGYHFGIPPVFDLTPAGTEVQPTPTVPRAVNQKTLL